MPAGCTDGHGHTLPTGNNMPWMNDPFHTQGYWLREPAHHHQIKDTVALPSGLTAPRCVDVRSPTQARAFVEGFKMGQYISVRAAARRKHPTTKGLGTRPPYRPRSPATYKGSAPRNQPPFRRHQTPLQKDPKTKSKYPTLSGHHAGGHHDPLLPSTDQCRLGGPDVEDQHGRVREISEAQHDRQMPQSSVESSVLAYKQKKPWQEWPAALS